MTLSFWQKTKQKKTPVVLLYQVIARLQGNGSLTELQVQVRTVQHSEEK